MNPMVLACGGWIASAVGAAATLDIAGHLSGGPRSARELAALTSTDERVLKRLMRVLVVAGLFAREADGRFANTPDSERLCDGHPQSVRRFCILAAGDYQRIFQDVLYSLETGQPATRRTLGGSLYAYLDRTPDAAVIYDHAMEDLARSAAAALASRIDASRVSWIVDVGGGRGTLLRAMLAEHPHVRGTCIDRASVCDRARRELAEQSPGLAARLEFAAGDFFAGVPAGADIYLLKNVLHNWGDDPSRQILRTLRTAMAGRPDARLLVIEPLEDGPLPATYKALDDLLQVVISEPGAAARSEQDFRRLLGESGFSVERVDALPSGHSVMQAAAAE